MHEHFNISILKFNHVTICLKKTSRDIIAMIFSGVTWVGDGMTSFNVLVLLDSKKSLFLVRPIDLE